jgi:hypothetical protein
MVMCSVLAAEQVEARGWSRRGSSTRRRRGLGFRLSDKRRYMEIVGSLIYVFYRSY